MITSATVSGLKIVEMATIVVTKRGRTSNSVARMMAMTAVGMLVWMIMTERINPYNSTLDLPGVLGQWSMNSISGLAALSGEIQRQASMIGYINAFYLFTIASAVAVPLAWLMRDVPKE